MKNEISRFFILLQMSPYQTPVGSSKESMFSLKLAFEFLKSNQGNCYHYNPRTGSAIYSKASEKLIMYCPAMWPPQLVIIKWTKSKGKLGMMVHACNSSSLEAEAGGSSIWGQPGLHSKTLSQTNKLDKSEAKGLSFSSIMFSTVFVTW
jgi:hypothetical protein